MNSRERAIKRIREAETNKKPNDKDTVVVSDLEGRPVFEMYLPSAEDWDIKRNH